MIPSSRKVGKDLFETLMKKGRSFTSESLNVRILAVTGGQPARFSVVVAKKMEKSAVQRNKYKRRVYSLLRPFLDKVQPGSVCALFLKKKVGKGDLSLLNTEIKTFFKKFALLK
ncbi:MAG: hypothetical protein UW34_C0005G0011 [Parcubacteria group bacterium GW2011_GWA2_44_15]|nr:MAG: hypothetical protein UW34_C0005G0011 [Parcubacteria group bacterium GW2011_GWA2_44_15]